MDPEPFAPSDAGWLRRHRELVEQRHRLARHPLFAACTKGELTTLVRWGDEVVLPPGVTLLRERTIGAALLAVLDGELEQSSGRGRPTTIGTGGWTGEVAVLGYGPEPFTVRTATACRLFVLGPRPVLSFASGMRGLRAGLFPGLSEREADERIRAMRAEGLPRWRQLRRRRPEGRVVAPAWLRIYATRRTGSHHELADLTDAPPGPPVTGPAHSVEHMGRYVAIGIGTLVATLTAVAALVPLPYYTVRGEMSSATDAVVIDGAIETAAGDILFPIVDAHQDTAFDVLLDWRDADAELWTRDEMLGGRRASDIERANVWLMADSQHAAIVAARSALGDAPQPAVDAVRFDVGDVVGPSGGLAFALAVVDLLSPGDLTGGRRIAATGAITPDGAVSAVGNVGMKATAARNAGCEVLLVPTANFAAAVAAPTAPMLVIPVDSLADALAALSS